MKGREEAHESPVRPLFWLERPVCLDWADKDDEGSSPLQRSAGLRFGLVGALVRLLLPKLLREG